MIHFVSSSLSYELSICDDVSKTCMVTLCFVNSANFESLTNLKKMNIMSSDDEVIVLVLAYIEFHLTFWFCAQFFLPFSIDTSEIIVDNIFLSCVSAVLSVHTRCR